MQIKRRCLGLLVALVISITNVFSGFISTIAYAEGFEEAIDYEETLKITDVTEDISQETKDKILMEEIDKEQLIEMDIPSAEEEVWVIVELKEPSLVERVLQGETELSLKEFSQSSSGKTIEKELSVKQDNLKKQMEKNKIEAEYKNSYTLLLNGFAALVKYGDIDKIKAMTGVKDVTISSTYYKEETYREEEGNNKEALLEMNEVENSSMYTGSGMVIGILDTGLDYRHSAFQKAPSIARVNKSDIQRIIPDTMSYSALKYSVEDVYYSSKIPFMFDYADLDTDVMPTEETVSLYGNDHGTHVAGIAAGNDEEIKGTAPEAQLAIFKVFSDTSNGADTLDILAALCDAVYLGVDVINMSLGSPSGFGSEKSDSLLKKIHDSVTAAGINLVASAGNSYNSHYGATDGDYANTTNPDTGIVSSPSSYSGSLSVASINASTSKSFLVGETVVNYNEISGHSFAEELQEESYEYVMVPGTGELSDYENINVQGKVAVIKRGTLSFNNKQLNAAAKGAVGCIIYNNRPGNALSMAIDDYKIPTAGISLEDGVYLEGVEKKVLTLSKGLEGSLLMSDFSSWGPLSSLELKPEITAPGGNIYSSLPFGKYGYMSGTSMAAPWLAGAATVVEEYVESSKLASTDIETETLVNRLLMSTAVPALNLDGHPYSPRKQGAGVANINGAINTDAYLYVYGEDKTKLELGDDKEERGVYTLSFHIKNMRNTPLKYEVDASAMTESVLSTGGILAEKPYVFHDAGVEILSVKNGKLDGNVVTVAGNKDAVITMKVTLSEDNKSYMKSNFPNGIYVEGFAGLKALDEGGVDLSIPYLAFFGDWTKAPMLDSNEYDGEEPYIYDSYPLGTLGAYSYKLGAYNLYLPEGVEKPESSYEKMAASLRQGNGLGSIGYAALGLLRNAKEINYKITDKATGRLLSDYTDYNLSRMKYSSGINKIYPAYGGSYYPTEYTYSPAVNNSELIFTIDATLDYDDPQNNLNSTWSMPIYVDSESPTIKEAGVYGDGEKIYLKLKATDNHYLMSSSLFEYAYVYNNNYDQWEYGPGKNYYNYMMPIYESKPYEVSDVVFDITNIKDKFNGGKFYLVTYDYAMNSSIYLLQFPITQVEEIQLDKTEATMKINDTMTLKATVLPENATDKRLIWSSSNDKVAVVNNGEVTSLAQGNTVITATSIDGTRSATCYVQVSAEVGNPILPTSIKLNTEVVELRVKGTYTLSPSFEPWNVTDKSVEWSVDNEAIATVKDGTVIGVAVGETTLRAVAKGGASTTCTIKVHEALPDFEIVDGVLTKYNGSGEVVEIPEGVTAINKNVFKENITIKKVKLPSTLKVIGPEAFRKCSKLEEINLPEGLEEIGEYAFYQCEAVKELKLPTTLKTIGQYAFYYCKAITAIEIPKGITRLESSILLGCSSLKDVSIPDTVVYIGPSVFDNCVSIETLIIPDSVSELGYTTAGGYNFSDCRSLTNIVLSKNIKELPQATFLGCSSLKEIDLSHVEVIGSICFQSSGFVEFTVPRSVKLIKERAFGYCNNLEKVIFQGSPEVEGKQFYNDPKLTTVEGNLTKLSLEMFYKCTALTSFKLPDTIKYIDDRAFSGCTNLTEIVIGKDSEFKPSSEAMGMDVFTGCNKFEKFTVEVGNKNAAAVDGILYDNEVKFLAAIPNALKITTFNMPDTVEVVNGYAFYNRSTLETLNLSKNLKEVGDYAFFRCSKLTKLNLPDQVKKVGSYSFNGCTGISELTLGKDLEYIGDYAFYGTNSKVKEIVIPDKVSDIGKYAFYGYSAVERIDLGKAVKNVGERAFYNCKAAVEIVIPNTIENIYNGAFYGCQKLKTVNLPEGLKTIGEQSFYQCYELSEIILPDTLTSIGANAFYEARALKTLKLSNSLTELPTDVFSYLNKNYSNYGVKEPIKVINIPASIVKINKNAFRSCSYIEQFNVSEENTAYASTAEGILIDLATGSIYIWPNGNIAQEFTIPDNMTTIPSSMFQGKTNIRKIIVPGTITKVESMAFAGSTVEEIVFEDSTAGGIEIGGSVFKGCTKLSSITLPKGLTKIGSNAFEGCTSLEKISIPNEVTSIGTYAFRDAIALKEVKLSRRLGEIPQGIFTGCTALETIEIPASVSFINLDTIYMPFKDCNNLSSITVEEGSKYYKSIDGILYDSQGLELLIYPTAKSGENYSVKSGVTRIGNQAFINNMNLKEVTLPDTLERVGDKAFKGCYNLKQYNFNSMKAPLLEVESYFAGFQKAWYGNFYDNYFTWDKDFNIIYTEMDLAMFYPDGGEGYENWLWDIFFNSKTETTIENMLSIKNLKGEVADAHEVTLSWDKPFWGEGYKVERAEIKEETVTTVNIESGENEEDTMTVLEYVKLGNADTTTFVDNTTILGKKYMYKVTAFKDAEGTYGPSATTSVYINPTNENEEEALKVINLIHRLPLDITLEDEGAIVYARETYNSLNEVAKTLVYNYEVLVKAEDTLKILIEEEAKRKADIAAATAVEELISAIGEVTLDSEEAIEAARKSYEALTDDQKNLVTNYEVLVSAEKTLAELKAEAEKNRLDQEAAKAVKDLIDEIGVVTLESESKIEAARIAYTSLTEEQKALVDNYEILLKAEEDLKILKEVERKKEEDRAAALIVVNLINEIGEVTLDSEERINRARNAYEELTQEQKLLVDNYETLVAAEKALEEAKEKAEKEAEDRKAAKAVCDLINNLPTEIKVEDEATILEARKAYEALTQEQKVLVDNYEVLVAAEKALEEAKEKAEKEAEDRKVAKAVCDLINSLPAEIKVEDEATILEVRKAYEALTPEQKLLVDNYETLVVAEKALKEAKEKAEKEAKKEATDRKAAEEVIEIISKLPDKIKLNDEKAINKARTAYEALTKDQKLLVTNYDRLKEAEKALEKVKKDKKEEETKNPKPGLPQTGGVVGTELMLLLGVLSIGTGLGRRKRDRR